VVCYRCGAQAAGACASCHTFYCREHGDETGLCYRCRAESEARSAGTRVGCLAFAALALVYGLWQYVASQVIAPIQWGRINDYLSLEL
jgi:hypothetical protein